MGSQTHLGALAERLTEATKKLGTGNTNEERKENHRAFIEAGKHYIDALKEAKAR